MEDLNNNILNNNIAEDTSNILLPDSSAIKSGIVFKSNINSNVLNGYLNILSKAIQYLQFTVGLYNKEADYNEGNIASLVIKNNENYSIWQFRRNANNPKVLNNNPPITGASITTVNGIDIYEGGTLNTDWDKITENYDIEATPNTVMIRDEEGASNVNMPSNIENTTVVNNEYLEEQLQSGLSTKQDKLTAGTNVEITEDNVINVKGDVATAATQVTQTNEALGENVQTALDILKLRYMIPPQFIQVAEEDGTFNDNKAPANWYKNMYGVTTVWTLVFASDSVTLRTEGDLSNVDRVNGIQGDAGRNNQGRVGTVSYNTAAPNGAFILGSYQFSVVPAGGPTSQSLAESILDSSRVYTTANEFRMKNIRIRIFTLQSIEGMTIEEFINVINNLQQKN